MTVFFSLFYFIQQWRTEVFSTMAYLNSDNEPKYRTVTTEEGGADNIIKRQVRKVLVIEVTDVCVCVRSHVYVCMSDLIGRNNQISVCNRSEKYSWPSKGISLEYYLTCYVQMSDNGKHMLFILSSAKGTYTRRKKYNTLYSVMLIIICISSISHTSDSIFIDNRSSVSLTVTHYFLHEFIFQIFCRLFSQSPLQSIHVQLMFLRLTSPWRH